MTRYKVAELTGALLDAAVAQAEGVRVVIGTNRAGDTPLAYVFTERKTDEFPDGQPVIFQPSTSWAEGGPLIHREEVTFQRGPRGTGVKYWADAGAGDKRYRAEGPTHLIAAMRAIVALKFGEEVELP